MKRTLFFVFFIYSFSGIYAQISAEYNVQGDQALRSEDYQTARNWYSNGVAVCDLYSIERMVEIWKNQISMQEGMRLPMLRSFNCLKMLAEEGKKEAMPLLRDFYREGIGGIEINTNLADFWHREYGKSQGFLPDTIPDIIDNSGISKVPRKSLLSTHFHSFITYTFSPTMPYGLTAGIYFDKIGGYVSYRTDYKSVNAAYECNNTKVPEIEIENPLYEFGREKWQSRMLTGGLLYPIIKNRLFVSAGGGYGKRKYFREIRTINDKFFATGNKSEWCYNTEASYQGLTLEAGGMFVWKKLTVLGGVNSTQFKDLDVYIGLGLNF